MNEINSRFEILILEDAQEQQERRDREERQRAEKLRQIEEDGYCQFCLSYNEKNKKGCEWVSSMTAYVWDKDKEPDRDPNAPLFLCPECAEEYTENMREMWDAARGY